MKPAIKVITLGVGDLERSLAFYRDGLGLPTEGIVGTEFEGGAVAFFELSDGLILALWPRRELAKEARLEAGPAGRAQFSIGHNVGSKEEVDEVLGQARAAGAMIPAEPQDRAWGGYSGYFEDPDGHLWEVAWNPQLLP
ncbi:MAG: VOC family protein [Dehalococcoidia bacterium]|nr:VOC family protein [Dehalococcoidia bacterium]